MKPQIHTVRVTVRKIMLSCFFEMGLNDVRSGIPFDWRNDSWGYERGRLFGHIAPLDMPLKIGGRLNPKALALGTVAFERKLVI